MLLSGLTIRILKSDLSSKLVLFVDYNWHEITFILSYFIFHAMAVDALAPCAARSSAATVFNIQGKSRASCQKGPIYHA